MKTAIYTFDKGAWTTLPKSDTLKEGECQLVLCFAGKDVLLAQPDIYDILRERFAKAVIAICSTAGEICHTQVRDEGFTITAIEFTSTNVIPKSVHISDLPDSYSAGKALLDQLDKKDLAYVMVLSDGGLVNGSELVRGFHDAQQDGTLITGGLAGDGTAFVSTLVGVNGPAQEGEVVAIGFYGEHLRVGHGSKGGWETFGLERTITRSDSNVLYELDNKNALSLYRRYLGPDADQLPGAALLFPLAVTLPGAQEPIVRTILSIGEADGSMTFAGDIPEGSIVRFMRANFDKLTNAASDAATASFWREDEPPEFALLISCVGRKMILHERTEEEVAAVDEIFKGQTLLSGFYSYGEISPLQKEGVCQLHNQTMTITTFYEEE